MLYPAKVIILLLTAKHLVQVRYRFCEIIHEQKNFLFKFADS